MILQVLHGPSVGRTFPAPASKKEKKKRTFYCEVPHPYREAQKQKFSITLHRPKNARLPRPQQGTAYSCLRATCPQSFAPLKTIPFFLFFVDLIQACIPKCYSLVVLVSELDINGLMQYGSLCIWLLSSNTVFMMFMFFVCDVVYLFHCHHII